jgi:uroporphyrinogen-III synthase
MAVTHILITRPLPEGNALAQCIASETHLTPVQLPAYEFAPLHPGALFEIAEPRDGRRLAIFTSTRAVQFGLRQLPAGFLNDVEIAAVGPATAGELERHGYHASWVPAENFSSEGLLDMTEIKASPGHALVFTAPGGRTLLQDTLEALGWNVQVLYVYERKASEFPPEAIVQLDGLASIASVWTSEHALRSVFNGLSPPICGALRQGPAVVTSKRLEHHARQLGIKRVTVAGGPSNEAILATIRALI